MGQTYDQRRELLAKLWEALWPVLRPAERERLLSLPQPCHNHLEDRMRKEGRGQRLIDGCYRIAKFDCELLLEGLRLYPHAICRAAEVVGPVPDSSWSALQAELNQHRLWRVGQGLTDGSPPAEGLWQAIEALERHRELPQTILDFVETGRPAEEAPLEEFLPTLSRFLVRAKLERMRFATYAAIKAVPAPNP